MKVSTFFYNVRQGLINIGRNKMFSLASTATMMACIFLLGLFYSIGINFQDMVKDAESEVSVTVFFNEGITDEQIQTIGDEIKTRPEVASYQYISADEAWENYKKEYFAGNEDLAAGFDNDNPLANDASYEIYMKDVSQQSQLVEFLQGLDGVREVKQSEVAARTLTDFNRLITLISIGVIVVLVAVSIFLISNTVTVGITVRREEIAIMKLIGAEDSFVRTPFIVEGVTIGLIGSAIPLVLLYFLYHSIISYVANHFSALSGMMEFRPVSEVFHFLIPVSLLLGVGIGYIGSRLTLHKHLNV